LVHLYTVSRGRHGFSFGFTASGTCVFVFA